MVQTILKTLTAPLTHPRGRWVAALLIVTGFASIVVGQAAPDALWTFPVTVMLLVVFVVGSAFILADEDGRLRVAAASAPSTGAILLGLTVLPQHFWLLFGLAVGWFVAAMMLFRQQTPREVMRAIRMMRKGNYTDATQEMDTLIKRDKDNPEHYRLRAMIFRLDNKPDRAKRDYEKILALAPEGSAGDAIRAEAYDGLSEVYLQTRRYEQSNEMAQAAHALYPDNWVPLYNLCMIHDRMGKPTETLNYGMQALKLGIPDVRQRLLAHFYLARAYRRQGDLTHANAEIAKMKNLWSGMEGLQKLLSAEQSAPLNEILRADVELARDIMLDEQGVEAL